MADVFVEVYDTRTNKKLPNRVPEGWLRIFDYLSKTPKQRASNGPRTTEKES